MQSQPLQNNRPKRRKTLGRFVASVFLVGLGVVVWLQQQYIADSISFWRYEPTAAIAAISERTQLTDEGKFAFYAAHPVVDGNRTFNATCDRKEEGTAVLGCYVANRIYIYDVQDTRLNGIKEVTAAHELLHAVYQRLSGSERSRVDALVEAEFTKLKDDPSYTERMAFYARTEPGQRDNELHSIIGTEVVSVSPELEQHYSKYFRDRSVITALYADYQSVFTELSERAAVLSSQLDTLNTDIKQASEIYNTDAKELNSDIAVFNERATAGDFSSTAQFNAQRQALVLRVNTLERQRVAINTMVSRYEQLRDEYNNTVTRSNELYQSIDSSLAPAPKV